jgi:hypothetical protein
MGGRDRDCNSGVLEIRRCTCLELRSYCKGDVSSVFDLERHRSERGLEENRRETTQAPFSY